MLDIVIYGVIPTYLLIKQVEWWWWVGYVAVILAYRHQKKIAKYVAAASNIVAAKVTFDILSTEQQKEVQSVTLRTILACGGPQDADFKFMNEAQKYGWYALGMRELGVKPAVLIPQWNIVKNPYLPPPRMWIESSGDILMKKAGVHVSIAEGATPN